MSLNNLIKNVNSRTNKLLSTAIVLILGAMSLLVFINVVLRYGFNTSINLTEELSRFLLVWLTFLGAVLAFSDNQHVRVSVFLDKLNTKTKALFEIVLNSLMMYCCYLIIAGSYAQFILNYNNLAPISGIPLGVSFLASLTAGILIAIILLFRILSNVQLLITQDKS